MSTSKPLEAERVSSKTKARNEYQTGQLTEVVEHKNYSSKKCKNQNGIQNGVSSATNGSLKVKHTIFGAFIYVCRELKADK